MKASKTVGKTGRQTERFIGPIHHAGRATIPSSFLRVGSALRLGSPCSWDRDQITGETNCCTVRATSKDIWSKTSTSFARTGRPNPGHTAHYCATLWRGSFGTRKLLASQGHSRVRRIRWLQSRFHSERRFVRNKAVHYVMAATRCAVFVFKHDYCIPLPASSMVRVPVRWLNSSCCMNGSSFNPSQRAFHFSPKGSSSAKCGILSRLTAGPAQQRLATILLQVTKKRVRLL